MTKDITVTEPMAVFALLVMIEAAILFFSDFKHTRGFFKYLPSMFWIYFLPMIANTLGLLPSSSSVYDIISTYCLPASLVLLLVSVDLRAIVRLGPVALAVMLAGSVGVFVGTPIVMAIFHPWLPEGAWAGFGALSASWVGGSANMIAVKESLNTPDSIYLPMVVVDTIVPYAWMGVLIVMSSHQQRYDRWNKAKTTIIDDLKSRVQATQQKQLPLSLSSLAVLFALAAGGMCASILAARQISALQGSVMSVLGKIFSTSAWTIVLATTIGVGLSCTPVRKVESHGASKLGYMLLYLVLASIGAKASLDKLGQAPVFIAAGFVLVMIHGLFIIAAGRLLKAPISLMAAASQANVGGPASAPVVAEVYQPGLAPVGLLLAVLGNIIGTYSGILCGNVCKFFFP